MSGNETDWASNEWHIDWNVTLVFAFHGTLNTLNINKYLRLFLHKVQRFCSTDRFSKQQWKESHLHYVFSTNKKLNLWYILALMEVWLLQNCCFKVLFNKIIQPSEQCWKHIWCHKHMTTQDAHHIFNCLLDVYTLPVLVKGPMFQTIKHVTDPLPVYRLDQWLVTSHPHLHSNNRIRTEGVNP